MWEVYQRIQSTCTVLRAFSKKQETATRAEDNTTEEDEIVPHSPSAINLSSALEDLSSLVHDVLKSKVIHLHLVRSMFLLEIAILVCESCFATFSSLIFTFAKIIASVLRSCICVMYLSVLNSAINRQHIILICSSRKDLEMQEI